MFVTQSTNSFCQSVASLWCLPCTRYGILTSMYLKALICKTRRVIESTLLTGLIHVYKCLAIIAVVVVIITLLYGSSWFWHSFFFFFLSDYLLKKSFTNPRSGKTDYFLLVVLEIFMFRSLIHLTLLFSFLYSEHLARIPGASRCSTHVYRKKKSSFPIGLYTESHRNSTPNPQIQYICTR